MPLTPFHPLMLPVTIAVLAGAVAYVLSRVSPAACKALALLAGVGVLGAGAGILAGADVKAQPWTWFSFGEGLAFSVELTATPLGMLVLMAAGAFAVLVAVYSLRDLAGQRWEGKFYAYMMWTLAGACLVALAGNLLVLLVGWEVVTLMLFLMVNQGRRDAPAGAAKAYGMLGFADACLLLAVALLVAGGGTGRLSLAGPQTAVSEMGPTGYFIYVLILLAALAKAGAIPVHTWIPSIAEDAPTPLMAYLPAALDKLLGIYLLAVLALRMFKPDGAMQVVMMIVGAVTILAAVLMAMMQHNLKRLLAFHAVSQVGYMVLGIGTGTVVGVVGGLFHMLNNSVYKSCLFLMSGSARRATGTDEIEKTGGLARLLPVTFASGLVAALAISGVPPFNGFASKWLVYQGTLELGNRGLAIVLLLTAVIGSALTLASFVKVMYSAFLSSAPKGAAWLKQRPRESWAMAAPMVVLAAACVVLGLFPQLVTGVFQDVAVAGGAAGPPVEVSAGGLATGPIGLWNPTQATVLIVLGLLGGLGLVWLGARGRVRVVRPFLAGEVPAADDDRFRVPGTHFYETVGRLPAVGPLLREGQAGAMDLYHWFGRYGNDFVQILRAQHTGLVCLYAAWAVLGLTITLAYLLIAGT